MSYKLRWFVAALVAALAVAAWLPIEQRGVVAQSEKQLKSALTMYAVARGLNAVTSVAQGELAAMGPVGVGVEVAVGEALKPVQEIVDLLWLTGPPTPAEDGAPCVDYSVAKEGRLVAYRFAAGEPVSSYKLAWFGA